MDLRRRFRALAAQRIDAAMLAVAEITTIGGKQRQRKRFVAPLGRLDETRYRRIAMAMQQFRIEFGLAGLRGEAGRLVFAIAMLERHTNAFGLGP
jgi:hypothetical protein